MHPFPSHDLSLPVIYKRAKGVEATEEMFRDKLDWTQVRAVIKALRPYLIVIRVVKY